ncbi:MAG: heme-binding protein, partial [Acetobacteraceae bacterium]
MKTKLPEPIHVAIAALLVAIPLSAQADGLLTTHRLSAALAADAARAAVESCAKQGYAETAVVVDADGVPQAVLRGDRAGAHTLNSANDKA